MFLEVFNSSLGLIDIMDIVICRHRWRHQKFDLYDVLRSYVVNVKFKLIVLVNFLHLTLFAVGHVSQTKLLEV